MKLTKENQAKIDDFFNSITREELAKKIIEAGYMKEKCCCIDCIKVDYPSDDENFCAGKICAAECESVLCDPKSYCHRLIL